MIDLGARRKYAENNSNKALMDGVKNALVEGFKAKGSEDTLRMVFEKKDDQEVKTILEKIGNALPLIYKAIPRNFMPKIFPVRGFVEVTKTPPVEVKNLRLTERRLEDILQAVTQLGQAIANMPQQKMPDIKIPKIEIPKGELSPKLEELIEKLNDKIDNLKPKDVAFPRQIEISNFPKQMIPTPVTNISINGLQGVSKTSTVTVGTTLTQLPSYGQLFNRRSMILFNNSASTTVYIGGSDVTTANGLPVLGQTYSPAIDAGYNMVIYGVTSASTADVRVMEVSKDTTGNIQE